MERACLPPRPITGSQAWMTTRPPNDGRRHFTIIPRSSMALSICRAIWGTIARSYCSIAPATRSHSTIRCHCCIIRAWRLFSMLTKAAWCRQEEKAEAKERRERRSTRKRNKAPHGDGNSSGFDGENLAKLQLGQERLISGSGAGDGAGSI